MTTRACVRSAGLPARAVARAGTTTGWGSSASSSPGYPSEDYPFGRRACDEALDPEPEVVTILDPRLRTAILPVYRIGFAAALGKPFSGHLEAAGPRYGWPVVTRAGNGVFLRTDAANLPGLAQLAPGASDPAARKIGVHARRSGAHVVVLGGRRLSTRAPRIDLDGRPLENGRRSPNWAVFEADLSAGLTCWSCLRTSPAPIRGRLPVTSPRSCGRDVTERYLVLPGPASYGMSC